jgi:hypothetical protein
LRLDLVDQLLGNTVGRAGEDSRQKTRPSNKGMKLTSLERIEVSQLIPGVRRTELESRGHGHLALATEEHA